MVNKNVTPIFVKQSSCIFGPNLTTALLVIIFSLFTSRSSEKLYVASADFSELSDELEERGQNQT